MKHKKEKILFVSHSLSRTGAPKVLVNIANSMNKELYDVAIYDINSSSRELVNEIDKEIRSSSYYSFISKGKESKNVFKSYLFKALGKLFSISAHFEKELHYFKPDLVFINTIYHLNLSEITASLGIKTIRYFHELESYLFSLNQADKFRLLYSKDFIWACSNKVKTNLQKYYSKEEVKVIYPLVNLIDAKESKKNPQTPFKVISAASVNFRKGFDLWVNIALKTTQKNETIIFEWYGKANNEDVLFKSSLARIPESLKKNIIYRGETLELQDKISESDLFLLPSREDPFPIVCIEAIGNSIPCVGFDSGGIQELTDLGVASTVPLGEIEKLASLILDFVDGKKIISPKKCRDVYQSFHPQKVLHEVEQEISKILLIR